MKRNIPIMLAVLVSAMVVCHPAAVVGAPPSAKKIVAVIPFDSPGEPQWGVNTATYLETLLAESGKFRVVERAKLDKVLREHEMYQTGLTEMAKSLGQFLEVDYILGGSITPIGDSYSLNAKFIDIETAEIVVAKSTTFKSLDRLRLACKVVVDALAERLYGTGSGNSKKELFAESDSRQFFDAAGYVIRQVEGVGVNVSGSLDQVQISKQKVYLKVKTAVGMRKGVKVIVQKDGFEGVETVGVLYIDTYRQGGRSEASWLEQPTGLSMGQKFSSDGYRNNVAVGGFEDAEEDNANFVQQFTAQLQTSLSSSAGLMAADSVDDVLKSITPANRTAKLKALFTRGVDLYLTGRFIGTAGQRRLDLEIYNCYDGALIKKVTIETQL